MTRNKISQFGCLLLALLALPIPVNAQTYTVAPTPVFTGFDANGDPVSGGKVCSYLAGTSTAASTYSDSAGTLNANPVILDSAGRARIYLSPGSSYKLVLRTAGTDTTCNTGSILWSQDNIAAVPASSNNLDVLGTAGEAITAGQAVYLSDGTGSKTAGQWFKADATYSYASTNPIVGIAPNAIASAAVGSIRLNGAVSGLPALVVGSTYYLSTTPGSLTATAPTNNRRMVGVADSTSSVVLQANPNQPPLDIGVCNGRLTLASGTPVTTADQTAKTTLYFTPYKGNRCALYDGTAWTMRTFAEVSIAVPATTATMYDVWLYDNAGTLALELLAWTNDTTRATALTTQDGIYVKTGATTRRYLGSFRTTGVSGQTEDSASNRLVWNYYNRTRRMLRVVDTTDSWTYTINTWRQARGSALNQVAGVVGVAEVLFEGQIIGLASNTNAGVVSVGIAIAEDATAGTTSGSIGMTIGTTTGAGAISQVIAMLRRYPAAGYHYWAWIEYSQATGTTTWYGDSGTTDMQAGLFATIEG